MSLRNFDPPWAVVLWIGLIYTTIPFVRRLREAFAARWPSEFIAYAVIFIVIITAAAAVAFLRRQKPKLSVVDLAWLAVLAAVAIAWTSRLMGQPEEAVHFVEYGMLGVLLYRALAEHIPDATVYVAAVLVGLLVGTVDEIIQWLVPGRFWDLRDIVLNGGAVALVQIAVWRLVRRPSKGVCRSSLRLLCRLAAVQALLLTLCLAATPQRLTRLADHLPLPQRLASGADAICEYGYRHAVNGLTFFRSRLSADALARCDRERAHEVAGELDASRRSGGLSRETVSPVDDPFGYEIRVHLFARNRNLHRARGQEPGSSDHRRSLTTAWRQNLILENSFGRTLDQSTLRWGPRLRKEIQATQNPDELFVSRVGAHLITRLSEGQLRTLMLALFTTLVACDILMVTRSRRGSPPG
jgi:VanZ family protein